jgi:hypothetical protein
MHAFSSIEHLLFPFDAFLTVSPIAREESSNLSVCWIFLFHLQAVSQIFVLEVFWFYESA